MRLLPILLMLLASCGGDGNGETLNVFAAASLRELLDTAADAFESETGMVVRLSTAGSGLVAEQILAGAPADVFLSAGAQEMERLVDAGLVRAEDVVQLFSNQLVVIAAEGSNGDFELSDLTRAARVAIAHPDAVPAGRYARAWLERQELWSGIEGQVVRGLDVRSTLAAVTSGGASFGIVYATDVRVFDTVNVVYQIPREDGPLIVYPGAVLAATPRLASAQRFVELLGEPRGRCAQKVVELGFQPVP